MRIVYAFILGWVTLAAYGYETETHERLVHYAYDQSIMSSGDDFWNSLGIEEDENLNSSSIPIYTTKFTRRELGLDPLRTSNALVAMRLGATQEDKISYVKNHFYDPHNDRPLTLPSLIMNYRSPNWALEDFGDIQDQKNSYKDARGHLHNALTSIDKENREDEYSSLFKSLGHVLHHLGDMAQPQHVRNDIHIITWLGDPSLREEYTKGLTEGDFGGNGVIDKHLRGKFLSQMNGYAPVIFTNPRYYWQNAGQGLAEFTNRGFLSKDTNFDMPDSSDYPEPSKDKAISFPIDDISTIFSAYGMSVPRLCIDPSAPCSMKFYATTVEDKYRMDRGGQNSFATTESIYNADIDHYNLTPHNTCTPAIDFCLQVINKAFTLNKLNFWSSYPFLLSRSVGYSAGLLNYFFRGRLETSKVEYSTNQVSFILKNAVDVETYPEWINENLVPGGEMVMVYRYRDKDGNEFRGKSNTVILNENIAPGDESLNRIIFNYNLPDGVFMFDQRIVYNGQIGSELHSVGFGQLKPHSALFAAINDVKRHSSINDISTTKSILRSLDGGKSWQISLGEYNTKTNPDGIPSSTFLTSYGVGKLRVNYGSEQPPFEHRRSRRLQTCTEDGGVTWFDCTLPTFHEVDGPFIRPEEALAINTGDAFMAFAFDANLKSPGYGAGTHFNITEDMGDNWVRTHSTPTFYPRGFRLIRKGEISVVFFGLSGSCDGKELNLFCSKIGNTAYFEIKSIDRGRNWYRTRNQIPIDEGMFYHSWAQWENMLDINRMIIPKVKNTSGDLLAIVGNNNWPYKISFTDDNGVSELGEITLPQFTSHELSYFQENAYLGEGKMVIILSELRIKGNQASRVLLSEDFGNTWNQVNSLNVPSEIGTLDRFGYSSEIYGYPAIGAIEAVPLTDEGLYIVK